MKTNREEYSLILRPELAAFVVQMEKKLTLNDYKGGWDRDTIEDIIHSMREEFNELRCAKNMFDLAGEAVDIANFAMMVFDLAMKKIALDSIEQNKDKPGDSLQAQ